jgi:hypothetical protein
MQQWAMRMGRDCSVGARGQWKARSKFCFSSGSETTKSMKASIGTTPHFQASRYFEYL